MAAHARRMNERVNMMPLEALFFVTHDSRRSAMTICVWSTHVR